MWSVRLFRHMWEKLRCGQQPLQVPLRWTRRYKLPRLPGSGADFCPSIENLVERRPASRFPITAAQLSIGSTLRDRDSSTSATATSVFIMSPPGANGEASVGSDGPRQKGKATPDTLK